MELIIITIFVIGYVLITLEHTIKVDKAAPAILLGVLTWAVYALMTGDSHSIPDFAQPGAPETSVLHQLEHHLPEIVSILFFLMGAMTIVELIDINDGFHVITSRITTRSKSTLLWILCTLTFFLSATLDNLTTAIVMASLIRKIINDKTDRLMFASMVVIAANAGGAWSPIGDVTTTMLWIGDNISVVNIITQLFIPSVVCMLVPLAIVSFRMKGDLPPLEYTSSYKTTEGERRLFLAVGVGCLIFVPIFKTVTHLPPFMGMFFGVGVMWFLAEFIHKQKDPKDKSEMSIFHALERVDMPSILFFFGILAGVACLSSIGTLKGVAGWLNTTVGNMDIITMIIGVLSAVVDNVPLVAASMQMYDIPTAETLASVGPEQAAYLSEYFTQDGKFWEFLAYCAGTGGSTLIIGSAAGVAIMGIEKIEFFWYMKNFSWLALAGYIAGAITYLLMYPIMH
ncbi:MAG: sodium:proton antiporter NhaD [Chitinophagales bacterium]